MYVPFLELNRYQIPNVLWRPFQGLLVKCTLDLDELKDFASFLIDRGGLIRDLTRSFIWFVRALRGRPDSGLSSIVQVSTKSILLRPYGSINHKVRTRIKLGLIVTKFRRKNKFLKLLIFLVINTQFHIRESQQDLH